MSNILSQLQQDVITKDKVNLIKDMICKGASDNELQLFIEVCNRTGLNPLAKQCWAVKRWDASIGREVFSFQTGVDGFRVIANRSDKYAGQLGPFWCGIDGKWIDVWLDSKPPIAARVGVLRSDFKEPLWAVAKFSSYASKKKDGSLTPFWTKMPDLMIAKVAECLALRKAFPQDLSGVYSSEEMEQAEIKDYEIISKPANQTQKPSEPIPPVSKANIQNFVSVKETKINGLVTAFDKLGINEAQLKGKYNVHSLIELRDDQLNELTEIGKAIKAGDHVQKYF